MRRADPLRELERRLGHRFRKRALCDLALTHRSFANERDLPDNYERLEFLGDAVLGLVAADWLFGEHADLAEGELSKLKGYLVSEAVLARYAENLELGGLLRLGVGEERSGGRGKDSLLSDSMEAVFGAVFLDGGLKAARRAILPLLEGARDLWHELAFRDAKTRLQELVQARGWDLPRYRHVAEQGPDHEKRFTVECWVEERLLSVAAGPSKKTAEQRAAAAALQALHAPATPA